MGNKMIKWLIIAVMLIVIPTTGIMYWGATNLRGKLCISLTGLLIYVVLAFGYSWLSLRSKNFVDWLKH